MIDKVVVLWNCVLSIDLGSSRTPELWRVGIEGEADKKLLINLKLCSHFKVVTALPSLLKPKLWGCELSASQALCRILSNFHVIEADLNFPIKRNGAFGHSVFTRCL